MIPARHMPGERWEETRASGERRLAGRRLIAEKPSAKFDNTAHRSNNEAQVGGSTKY
jgi:hypothetical protein